MKRKIKILKSQKLLLISFLLFFSCTKQSTNYPAVPREAKSNQFDWLKIKNSLRSRIEKIKAKKQIPLIDIESSYGNIPTFIHVDMNWLAQVKNLEETVKDSNIAFIVLSPERRRSKKQNAEGDIFHDWGKANHILYEQGVDWFMPAGVGSEADPGDGLPIENGAVYRKRMFDEILRDHYPLMGEFYFRHYPSNQQIEVESLREKMDFNIPIDGPVGEEFFSFSAEHNIPFQIHYEIENSLLPPLEKMLKKYPNAIVIWAHFARMRKPELSDHFTPAWVDSMLKKYPNLYFDLSCTDRFNAYPPKTQHFTSPLWNRKNNHLKTEWKELISNHPWRFLAAFDLGSSRSSVVSLKNNVKFMNQLIAEFPKETAEIISYKAAWKLLFKEEI